MQIAGMRTIEFFKDAALRFLGHSNAIVLDPNYNMPVCTVSSDPDDKVLF